MKSFSSCVKEYLCEKSLEELGIGEKVRVKWKECCAKAYLRSVFLFLLQSEGEEEILSSQNVPFLDTIAYLLIQTYNLEAAVLPRNRGNRRGAILSLPQGTKDRIIKDTETWERSACDRCRVLFLRAAFLSCGRLLDPAKGYHAAFELKKGAFVEELDRVLSFFDVYCKRAESSDTVLLYLKESTQIEDLLSAMGSGRFALDLMNQKIEKSIRSNINRRQNFDGANLKKTVNGAQSVIGAIGFLEERGVLPTLPEHLQNAAKLRLSYPEVSLAELVERSEDKITKSGLNHRLQKLCVLAEKIKNEEE